MDFKFAPNINDAAEEKESGNGVSVGSDITLTYTDKTVQKVKLLAMNDLEYSVTWEMVSSEPAVSYSSAVHTISLRRITTQLGDQKGQTFIQWVTDFSNDASAEVIQDS